MKTRPSILLVGTLVAIAQASAQSVLFDFDNAPLHTSLPIDLTVDGVTAHLSATGQGFSIQRADVLGFTPVGFSGFCVYPNSVFAADLKVEFSDTVSDFSILYSPQELGCDDSAKMKVTAYLNGAFVGTNFTAAAFPGTWPSETLSFNSAAGFNSVLVHYDARPPTCQDWGPIFMADNMSVTLAPPEIVLTDVMVLANGTFQFAFTNTPARSFTVLSATNSAVPFTNWTTLGGVPDVAPGRFRFTDVQATNSPTRFYRVRSP